MKKTWKIYGISVILALLVNLAIFFVVPLIQILFGTVRQDKPILRDKLYRQANVYLPPKQKIQEKPVEQLKPMQMMTKTKVSPLPRSFTIDLSAAGEVRSSSVAGKGNGTPGGQGLGVMVYNPGETDTDADLIRGQTKPKHPLRAEREDVWV